MGGLEQRPENAVPQDESSAHTTFRQHVDNFLADAAEVFSEFFVGPPPDTSDDSSQPEFGPSDDDIIDAIAQGKNGGPWDHIHNGPANSHHSRR